MEERENIKKHVINILEKLRIKYIETSGLFDIIAKHKGNTIFIKIITNIDGLTENTSRSLSNISYSLNAYAIVIGSRTRIGRLHDGIIYKRFDIPCTNAISFEKFMSGLELSTESFRGGEFVYIDPKKLRVARMKRGLTQDELANKIGVSKKCIYEHEREIKKAKKEIAETLSKVLEFPITANPNIKIQSPHYVEPRTEFEKIVYKYFSKIGMNVSYVSNVSFNIVAKDEEDLLTYAKENIREYKIDLLKNVSKFLKKPALFVSKDPIENCNIPNISKDELEEMSKKKLKRIAYK